MISSRILIFLFTAVIAKLSIPEVDIAVFKNLLFLCEKYVSQSIFEARVLKDDM